MGILDRQQFVDTVFPPLEGNGRQGSQTLLIQLQPDVFSGLYRAVRGGKDQQQHQSQCQADQRALAGAAQGAEAIIRGRCLCRLSQKVHAGAAYHIVCRLGIHCNDGFQDRQRVPGIRTGDFQREQVGIRNRGGSDGSVDAVYAQSLPQLGMEIVGVHQIGKGLAQLFSRSLIVVAGSVGDVRHTVGIDPDGKSHFTGVHGGVGPPVSQQPQTTHYQHQRQRDPIHPAQDRPEFMQKPGEVDIAFVLTVKLLFVHWCSPPFRAGTSFPSCSRRNRHRPRSHSRVCARNHIHSRTRSHTHSRVRRRAGTGSARH